MQPLLSLALSGLEAASDIHAGGSVTAGLDVSNLRMENKLAGAALPSVLHRITTTAEPGSGGGGGAAAPARRAESGGGGPGSRFAEYSASALRTGTGAGAGAGAEGEGSAVAPGDWVGGLSSAMSEAALVSARFVLRPVDAPGSVGGCGGHEVEGSRCEIRKGVCCL